MKEFIEYIAKCLVDNTDSVVVEEKNTEDKKIVITLRVSPLDIGKVIGKQGRTAQSMRTLLSAYASKNGKRAVLEIRDK